MTSPTDRSRTQASPVPCAVLDSLAAMAAGPAFVAAGWSVDTTVPHAALVSRDLAYMSAPARLVLSFGRPVNAELFEGHYHVRHLPLVLAMPRHASIQSALVADDGSGQSASYHWVTTLTFASVIDLVACLSSRAGQDALADIATFATGGATARIDIRVSAHRRAHRHPT